MDEDYNGFLKSLLNLHDRRIEERLNQSGFDLEKFFDYTQVRLDRSVANHVEMEPLRNSLPHSGGFFDNSKFIMDVKKIQDVIIKIIDSSKEKPKPEMRLIALVYHEENTQIDSSNMDLIASINGWDSKFSGKKLKDIYNGLSDREALKHAQKKYTKEEKQKVKIL